MVIVERRQNWKVFHKTWLGDMDLLVQLQLRHLEKVATKKSVGCSLPEIQEIWQIAELQWHCIQTHQRPEFALPMSVGLEISRYHYFKTNRSLVHLCMRWSVTVVLFTGFIKPFASLHYHSSWSFPVWRSAFGLLYSHMLGVVLVSREKFHCHITNLMLMYFLECWDFLFYVVLRK